MKKLSILIALLVVAAFGFAQDVTIDGDATLTVGFDLDSSQFGFKNEASAELEVKWTFDDAEAGGTGAYIKLTGMDFTAEDDAVDIDDPSVEAGLIFAPITVKIYSAPSLGFGNAEGFEFTPDDPDDPRDDVDPELSATATGTANSGNSSDGTLTLVETGETAPTDGLLVASTGDGDYYFTPDDVAGDAETTGFQGFTITADLDPLSLDVFVATDGTWVENTENAFAFGATVTASIDPLTVEAGVVYGPTDAAELGATVGLGGTFGPATVDVGFDLFEEDYDASVEIGVDLGVASITSLTYLASVGGADLEMYEEVVIDASAAVDGLTFVNTTQLETILVADLEWYNGTDLAYDLGGIKPFALVELYDVGADLQVDLEAGVELTGQIELTTFTLKWSADDVTNDNLGAITFATKIEY